MAHYIDGFVFPVSKKRLTDYQQVAGAVADIYREHGAIEYVEFVGDDMHRDGTRSFPDMAGSGPDEAVVFGWIVFESRESRDSVNRKVEADPRMTDLIAPIMDPENPVFDPSRMAYGGFLPLVKKQGA